MKRGDRSALLPFQPHQKMNLIHQEIAKMSINQWPNQERPRERLLQQGANVLSDAELLAILIRHGKKGQSAVDLSRKLLQQYKSLRGVLNAPVFDFCAEPGLGTAKYCQLQAAAEMGRRCLKEAVCSLPSIRNSHEAADFLIAHLRDFQQEVFGALFLDNKHHIIQFEYLFYGTINTAAIYPREVVKRALFYNAAAIIVAHNHPSGIAEPSASDIAITDCLKKALILIDIKLLDHLVVAGNSAVSMANLGLM